MVEGRRGGPEGPCQVLRATLVAAALTDAPLEITVRNTNTGLGEPGLISWLSLHRKSLQFCSAGFFIYKRAYSARILCG